MRQLYSLIISDITCKQGSNKYIYSYLIDLNSISYDSQFNLYAFGVLIWKEWELLPVWMNLSRLCSTAVHTLLLLSRDKLALNIWFSLSRNIPSGNIGTYDEGWTENMWIHKLNVIRKHFDWLRLEIYIWFWYLNWME